jgi:carbon monoxide dehydrogenase subunit G
MLHFEGTKDLPRPAAEVWSRLRDARFLVQCIPGVESVAVSEPDRAACTIRPGFAFVRGTLELTLQVAEVEPGKSARVQLHSKGIGTTSDVEASYTVEPAAGGTHLRWTADVKELGGLLKAVPQGLVKAAAQKVIGDAWAAVEQELAGPGAAG